MRTLLLALLIVLLPLRGWVGDAMATGVPAPPVHAMQNIASPQDMALASGAFSHKNAGQAAPCADHATAATPGGDTPCKSCPACDICHSVAHAPPVLPALPVLTAGAPLAPPLLQPASAERAAGFKPPIS